MIGSVLEDSMFDFVVDSHNPLSAKNHELQFNEIFFCLFLFANH